MLDINFIRENPEKIKAAAKKKKIKLDVDKIISLDKDKRALLIQVENLRSKRNTFSKKIPTLKDKEKQDAVLEVKELKKDLGELEPKLENINSELNNLLLLVPSIPDERVPEGEGEDDNLEIRKWGEIPKFDFEMRDHVELGEMLDIIDLPRGSKLSGTRSYFLKSEGALLEQAVLRFVLDHILSKGFKLITGPFLVRDFAMVGTGFFPLGEEDTYKIEKDKLNLIGTSEVTMASYHSGEVFTKSELPIRYVSISSCFRREAGTYGKDTRGLYRVHQFYKVEQVVLCENDSNVSTKEHELILKNSEEILQKLNIPYRVAIACGAEIGLGQVLKHEIESWMPSRKNYSETHSCSSLHDFQSRRLNIKYKDGKETKFVHTLNNTAIASPRILIPLLELNQNKDGSVNVPEVLVPYMNGIKVIKSE